MLCVFVFIQVYFFKAHFFVIVSLLFSPVVDSLFSTIFLHLRMNRYRAWSDPSLRATVPRPNKAELRMSLHTCSVSLTNNSFYTSKTVVRSSFMSSYQPVQSCLCVFSVQFCNRDMWLNYLSPRCRCTPRRRHVLNYNTNYLHFITLGELKMVKQMQQVISDGSTLPLLTWRDCLSQQPLLIISILS